MYGEDEKMDHIAPDQMEGVKFVNVCGVIPLAGPPLDFGMDWHDCLMPIAPNYTMLERAVVECAIAGCSSIWLCCDQGMTPLIRHRLGDYVLDPVYKKRAVATDRVVPIYYVGTQASDRKKWQSLSWSALHAAYVAYRVAERSSKWLTPSKFYVAWPYGVLDPQAMASQRANINSKKPFAAVFQGRTFKDGLYLPFTFSPEDWYQCRTHVFQTSTRVLDYSQPQEEWRYGFKPTRRLPPEERYSARHWGPDEVFKKTSMIGATYHELPWFWQVSSWSEYSRFLGSSDKLEAPSRRILGRREFNPMGIDVVELPDGEDVVF